MGISCCAMLILCRSHIEELQLFILFYSLTSFSTFSLIPCDSLIGHLSINTLGWMLIYNLIELKTLLNLTKLKLDSMSQNEQKINIKKSQICPICGQSDLISMRNLSSLVVWRPDSAISTNDKQDKCTHPLTEILDTGLADWIQSGQDWSKIGENTGNIKIFSPVFLSGCFGFRIFVGRLA